MAIKQFQYRPDTCGCIIIQDYDDVADTASLNRFITVCSFHSVISGDSNRHAAMRENNQRKNKLEGIALSNFSSDLLQTLADGSITYKNGVTFNWSWSGTGDTRVLTVSYSGITLSTQKKNTWQNFANTQFGVGKVVIQ